MLSSIGSAVKPTSWKAQRNKVKCDIDKCSQVKLGCLIKERMNYSWWDNCETVQHIQSVLYFSWAQIFDWVGVINQCLGRVHADNFSWGMKRVIDADQSNSWKGGGQGPWKSRSVGFFKLPSKKKKKSEGGLNLLTPPPLNPPVSHCVNETKTFCPSLFRVRWLLDCFTYTSSSVIKLTINSKNYYQQVHTLKWCLTTKGVSTLPVPTPWSSPDRLWEYRMQPNLWRSA